MSKTIFFVDDDLKRISSYVDYLKDSGYSVVLEHDSSRTISKFKEYQNQIDIVILDMMMPVDDSLKHETSYGRRAGIYLLSEIRKLSSDVPIIVFTIVRDSKLKKEIEKKWKTPYLEKTLPSKLLEEIERILET